jgi:primosomal protein N' (replication factor Y)
VYLRCVQEMLEADPTAQALVMVPEINLTPQLEERFVSRFAPRFGAGAVVSLHSGMTNPQRLKSWLAAHSGSARIVLGTRMAVFASLPGLKLIVVDEEHDPSYKQQEGARYSARDLAIWRGREQGAKVLLGSATPSLESWHASRPPTPEDPEGGRYQRLHMPSRIGAGALARVRRVDMNQQPRRTVFSAPLLQAITERVARGEQSMVLLNRRGYAPVLHCVDCGWKSDCPHCSAHQVFHKTDRTLRCHHCGFTVRVPHHCPTCGSPDIHPMGRGTEQLEEQLAALLRNVQRPDGNAARIARIDADTTKAKGALEAQLAQVHAGEVDVLVGTQMIAKGHDFRRITLVAAVQPDGALFSSDFRAPERLFALLMQAAGRAGRDAQALLHSSRSLPECRGLLRWAIDVDPLLI